MQSTAPQGIENPAVVIDDEPKTIDLTFSEKPEDFDEEKIDVEAGCAACEAKCQKCTVWCARTYHPMKKLPILGWIQDYKLNYVIRDIVAGLTIGLMLIPQSLAYAELAGLDPYFGLYASFLGTSIYTLLGTSKQCAIGPTAISSALMREFLVRPETWPVDPKYVGVSSPQLAQLLAFCMGCILSSLGLVQLGFLVNFISSSVVTGFIQAAAFTIPLGQLRKLFGVEVDADSFMMKIVGICKEVFNGNTNWYDFGVGTGSIALLVGLKELKSRSGNYGPLKNSKIVWFLGTAKAAIVTILMMLVAFGSETSEKVDHFLDGCVTGGRDPVNPDLCTTLTLSKIKDVTFPTFGPPSFGYDYEFCNKMTNDSEFEYNSAERYPENFDHDTFNFTRNCGDDEVQDIWFVSFMDMIYALGAGLIIQPIISYLELISLGKNFAKKDHYQVDPTQEMVALGFSNILNSMVFGVFPVTAGMSRSAVNYQANAATQLSAFVTAIVILLSVAFIADIFVYIPSAALAAVIIVSASSLFNFEDWKKIWRLNKIDMIPFMATFMFALRKSSLGLIVGIALHLIILLGKFMLPVNTKQSKGNTIFLEGVCMFPAGDSLMDKIQKNGSRLPDNSDYIIDFTRVVSIDAGAAFGIVDGIQFAQEGNLTLIINLANIEKLHIQMLKECGLPSSVLINGHPPLDDDVEKCSMASTIDSLRKPEITVDMDVYEEL